MAQNLNSSEIIVASGGGVALAPYGTSLPTTAVSSLDSAFNDLGYLGPNGAVLTYTPTVVDISAFQSSTPVKKIVTQRALTCAFTLIQQNTDTFASAFGGGSFSQVSAGQWKYTPPKDTDPLTEYCAVIDAVDGAKHLRFVMKRLVLDQAVALNLVRNQAADLPVTMTALTPDGDTSAWLFLTDAAEFVWTT